MPGMMSSLFTPDGADTRSDDTDVGADGGTGIDLSPTVGVEVGGSYDNADGSTTEWSNATEVGIDSEAAAAYTVDLALTSNGATE